MKKNLTSLLSMLVSSAAFAETPTSGEGDKGSIKFTGVISDSTCLVSLDKKDDLVDLERTTINQLDRYWL